MESLKQWPPTVVAATAASFPKPFAASSTSGVIRVTTTTAAGSSVTTLPAATTSTTNKITTTKANTSAANNVPPPRRCIFGCDANSTQLCRFPVHDHKRCLNWLKFFNINRECLSDDPAGGLGNLRVCLRHFNETKQMAKTRIKTTPTRLQKNAAVVAATICNTAPLSHMRLRPKLAAYDAAAAAATASAAAPVINVPAPAKRTNSISSAVSSTSGADSPSSNVNTISGSNSLASTENGKSSVMPPTPTNTLRNRKVYMITEKCGDIAGLQSRSSPAGQKRKMYLIMEEENNAAWPNDYRGGLADDISGGKCIKIEQALAGPPSKKLTLFSDKCDGQLTQKFEKILPEILNRIQIAKIGQQSSPLPCDKHDSQQERASSQCGATPDDEDKTMERLPITLPPKKNRNKILASAISTEYNTQHCAAATPVIVANHNNMSNHSCLLNTHQMVTMPSQTPTAHQRNINLSPDFLFLMKMLPKLESIPEPHKNHVKNCIEKIITQNSSSFAKH